MLRHMIGPLSKHVTDMIGGWKGYDKIDKIFKAQTLRSTNWLNKI